MSETKKVGRPSRFDRAEAVRQAMLLFWEHGYEGTTLEALLAAMGGLTPPSFYHAFGSKEALFCEAVDLYAATVGSKALALLQGARTAREGVAAFLLANAEAISDRTLPRGCLMVSGAVNCAPASRGAQDYVSAFRQRAPDAIRHRLEHGVAEGEIDPAADIDLVASFYVTVLHGMAQRAADGESRERLLAIARHAMTPWKAMLGPAPLAVKKRSAQKRSAKTGGKVAARI